MQRRASYISLLRQDESGSNVTTVHLNVTWLRIHPTYSAYVNWSQSIVLGFAPAVMLIYFNTKIYLDIRWVSPRIHIFCVSDAATAFV